MVVSAFAGRPPFLLLSLSTINLSAIRGEFTNPP